MKIETDLSKFNNSWYNPGNKAKILLWFLVNTLVLNNYLPIPVFIKVTVLRLFGAKVGDNVMIKPKVNIKYPWFLEIGNYVWIGEQVWIDNFVKVVIEDHACISQGAMLLTGNHNYKKTTFDLIVGEITLEEGAWAGAKTVICPGVRMGANSLLTVGSIATSSIEANWIYQGNPAQKIKPRELKA